MTYKGYSARIEYSDEDECFVGRVAGIRDIITFHGESVEEIRQAFKESMDFYLETCAEGGETANKAVRKDVLASSARSPRRRCQSRRNKREKRQSMGSGNV